MLSLGLSICSPAIWKNSARVYDASAQAIFDAFTTPPTDARKDVIETFVLALKAADVWDELDIFYVLAAETSQAARINWKNPGVKTSSAVNSPVFAADRGYTGNGTSARLDTGWVPSTDAVNFTQDAASIWVWSRTSGQSTQFDVGALSVGRIAAMRIRSGTDQNTNYVNTISTASYTGVTDGSGFFGFRRLSSTDEDLWRNGSQVGTKAGVASAGLPTASLWGLGCPSLGSESYSVREEAFLAAGGPCVGKEAAFYAAVLAYMQAVGAA